MKCQIIQTERLEHAQKAEITLFNCLKNLPADYYLYRELKLSPIYLERVKGLQEVKPDFVVVGPDTGAVSIEVKDWNISRNSYRWINQYEVEITQASGQKYAVRNPADQADRYLHALQALLKPSGIFVSSLLAFPLISRQDFLNKFADLTTLSNPQSRFFMDLKYVLFRDDIEQFSIKPEEPLARIVQEHPKFSSANDGIVRSVANIIMPETFKVGDTRKSQEQRDKMRILSEEQQAWAFDLSEDNNYLLDVPGSGKTNVLISKALHLLNRADKGARPRILLTTYNTNLENNIHQIFTDKVAQSWRLDQSITDDITILGMPRLVESIVKKADPSILAHEPGENNDAYEDRMKEWAVTVLDDSDGSFKIFDYVLIDEVQDFDDIHLFILSQVCRGKRYFFVGDIGQKIYDRSHNLKKHGIVAQYLQIQKSFRMYRTPKYIAELAIHFVKGDEIVRNELEKYGYLDCFQYPNELDHAAVLLQSDTPSIEVTEHVKDLLSRRYSESDILLVTSEQQKQQHLNALHAAEISTCTQIGQVTESDAVMVADFMNVKGLEREIVMVSGIEDLFERDKQDAVFSDAEDVSFEESLSRRKIYVALTRAMEQLLIVYRDRNNRFIQELLLLDQKILKKRRKRAKHG